MTKKPANISEMRLGRRTVLKIAGGAALAITFFPRVAFAARNSVKSIRTGLQPGNKTRLVIETASRPSHTVSYLANPNRLVVTLSNTSANNAVKPKLASGTLVNSVTQTQNGNQLKVTAALTRSISQMPKNQIMILEPNGDNAYRLVLDFMAGTNSAATSATAVASSNAAGGKNKARKPVIVIDAGHGGKDPGCIGPAGVREKNVVLSVARKLRNRLTDAGYTVYMTRDKDIFLNLGTRANIAEKHKADLFLSLHANANPKESMQGFSIYTLSKKASDEEAQKLADAENAADKIGMDEFDIYEPDIRNALSSLQSYAHATASVTFGAGVQKTLRNSGVREQPNGSLRSAPFMVLRSTVPGALIEIGHLSNRAEEKQLNSDAHQNKLASTIAAAVNKYDFDVYK